MDLISGIDQAQTRFPPDAGRGSRHDSNFLFECIHFSVSLNSTITDLHFCLRPTRLMMRGIVRARLLNGSPMSGRRALPRPECAVEGIGIFVAEQVGDFVGLN